MAKREVWVGIDVSKRRLDVALGVHGELLQVDNDPGGFTVLLEKLGALGAHKSLRSGNESLRTDTRYWRHFVSEPRQSQRHQIDELQSEQSTE